MPKRLPMRGAEAAASALRLYIDTPKPKTHDMERWPSCMRQTLRVGVTDDAEAACLVIPTVNINCEWDVHGGTLSPSFRWIARVSPTFGGFPRGLRWQPFARRREQWAAALLHLLQLFERRHLARGVGQGGRRTISERSFTRSD